MNFEPDVESDDEQFNPVAYESDNEKEVEEVEELSGAKSKSREPSRRPSVERDDGDEDDTKAEDALDDDGVPSRPAADSDAAQKDDEADVNGEDDDGEGEDLGGDDEDEDEEDEDEDEEDAVSVSFPHQTSLHGVQRPRILISAGPSSKTS